jgi:propionyl-CoA carboxylase alpha chain
MSLFSKVLVANRGEIALRILRTLKSMGIQSVVIYHEEDRTSLAVRAADEAIEITGMTPVSAYLDIDGIVAACRFTSADAVHPGFGFLAENASFAKRLKDEGIEFIGPDSSVIETMGDKITAKQIAMDSGVRVLPGRPEVVARVADAESAAEELGYPVILKAAAGGGGKGMRIVRKASDCAQAFELASGEAIANFADGRLFVEKYIEGARHIEIQILADGHGNTIHLGERECSIQRRHQKIIEEAPSPFLDTPTREAMGAQAVDLARAAGYRSAGTVEFVVDRDKQFYFLEMNTRLQVEHPVTEMITGIDLVAEQIRIAAGEPLGYSQTDVQIAGHAVECRIYAEDADAGFLPTSGTVLAFGQATGSGLRFDHDLTAGREVSSSFDPMLGKLICHAETREQAIERAAVALGETVILGVKTNTDFLARILRHQAFSSGAIDTDFLDTYADQLQVATGSCDELALVVAAACLVSRPPGEQRSDLPEPLRYFGEWRN